MKTTTTKTAATKTTTKAAKAPKANTTKGDKAQNATVQPAQAPAAAPTAPKAPKETAAVVQAVAPAGLQGLGLGTVATMDAEQLRALYEQGARDFRAARAAGDRNADARSWRLMAQAAIAMLGGVPEVAAPAPATAPAVELAKGKAPKAAAKATKAG